MSRTQELLLRVVERYQYHKNFQSENPETEAMARKMCDIDLYEMWALTQG